MKCWPMGESLSAQLERWKDNYQTLLDGILNEIKVRQEAEAERDELRAEIARLREENARLWALLEAVNNTTDASYYANPLAELHTQGMRDEADIYRDIRDALTGRKEAK